MNLRQLFATADARRVGRNLGVHDARPLRLFLAKIGVGERREVNHRFGSGARQEIEDAIVCEIPPNVVRRIGERPATDGNHLVSAE
jgi:hypothetical protein